MFLVYWNGRSFMDIHRKTDVTVFTDASGSCIMGEKMVTMCMELHLVH